ncbi:MAG: hypothetical protein L0338_33960 [Acidobacteria bacterium]|nr:hypothetical protein [Acidobacteriota bacterium]
MPNELTLSQEVQTYIEHLDSWDEHDLSPEEREEAVKARKVIEVIVSEIIKSRETLAETALKGIESLVRNDPDLIAHFLDERFTRELIDTVPGCVTRTLQLSRMDASRTPSKVTNAYLREATRTFILGLPQASIALSRAALEQGLKENLGRQLSGKFIKFHELLEEAEKWHLLDKVTKRIARDLAKAADDVLHEKPATLEKAREILEQLRGLLQHIYSAQGHY